jgi:hypothetical protein
LLAIASPQQGQDGACLETRLPQAEQFIPIIFQSPILKTNQETLLIGDIPCFRRLVTKKWGDEIFDCWVRAF